MNIVKAGSARARLAGGQLEQGRVEEELPRSRRAATHTHQGVAFLRRSWCF